MHLTPPEENRQPRVRLAIELIQFNLSKPAYWDKEKYVLQ